MVLMYDKVSLLWSLASSLVFTVLFSFFTLNLNAWEASDLQMLSKNSRLFGKVSKFLLLRKPPEAAP
jgi:hypothetical protein